MGYGRVIATSTLGAALIGTTLCARAGFIDERQVTVAPTSANGTVEAHKAPMAPGTVAALATVASGIPSDGTWSQLARGFGKNVPAQDALRAVVPAGIAVSLPSGVVARSVSWRGGVTRHDAATQILAQAGLVAQMDGAVLTLSAEGEKAKAATTVFASTLGATRIVDDGSDRISIQFKEKPSTPVSIIDAQGKPVDVQWDAAKVSMTFKRQDRFVVTLGAARVEVARVEGIAYAFDRSNSVGLTDIFERDGATYFNFSQQGLHVQVVDADGHGHGRQIDRFYRFDGVADEYRVTARGQTLDVGRRHEVRFYGRVVQS
jgi:hypothetical protein